MSNENELKTLLKNVEEAVNIYNLRAKELVDFSRVGYVFNDLNWRAQDQEAAADWEPDYDDLCDMSYSVNGGGGWFPSSFC